jgi:anti-sigma B factor antagonist
MEPDMQHVQPTFSVSVRHPGARPQLAILDLRGDVDRTIETELQEAFGAAEGDGVETIALNFSGVELINSTGIALIVGLLARARRSQRRLFAYGLSPHYEEIFHITRLADFIAIYAGETDALDAAA